MVRGVKRVGPISGAEVGEMPGHAVTISCEYQIAAQPLAAEKKIQEFVERAVLRCGSASALARELGVKPPTVSQWRAGLKKPDAVNLIHIQELGDKMA